MNNEVIAQTIEEYINGEVDEFNWDVIEEECKGEKKYYYNLIERMIKNYNQYILDASNELDFLISLRGFLISFKTGIKIPENIDVNRCKLGFIHSADGRIHASVDAPEYINSKFVSEAFQFNEISNKGEDNRYLLKTNRFISELTGYKHFNSEAQKLCVTGILKLPSGYSSLVVLPTGGGKSLVTQSLAYKEAGLTVVIVPTISLAIDQELAAKESIQHVTNREIFSYSSGSEKGPQIFEAIKERTARLLFISPEALIKNEDFAAAIIEANKAHFLKNIVIDEAHIVVDWGDLFRTDYQILEPWRRNLLIDNDELSTILMSATIDTNTGKLLKDLFSYKGKWVEFRCDALRKEPRYCVVQCKSNLEKKERIIELVKTMPHPLIVYTMRPERAETIKEWIKTEGYAGVETFTGDTGTNERDELIRGWKKNEFDVMVATSAFGMGVDKPDVRTVIHEFAPDNPSMYYQELGRGGRDGLPSLSILCLYLDKDLEFSRRSKVLRVEKIIGRWKSMFWSPKSKRVDDYAFIDTKVKPTYNLNYKYDIANTRDVQWNIYILLLFRRYNLIEIMDVQYEQEEERYIFKIKIIDERLSVIDDRMKKLLSDVRQKERERFYNEFEALGKAINNSSKYCFAEMFTKTYPSVSEYCAGCGAHNKIEYDDDDRFVLNKRIEIEENKEKPSFDNDALIITKNIDAYISNLVKRGVANYISNRNDLRDFESLTAELFYINFYEFRRIADSKNYFFLKNVCCVIYSNNIADFQKEFYTIQNFVSKGIVFIHVVPEDFEIDAAGRHISAYIGNNITDEMMER